MDVEHVEHAWQRANGQQLLVIISVRTEILRDRMAELGVNQVF